jgi:hypothetical protein
LQFFGRAIDDVGEDTSLCGLVKVGRVAGVQDRDYRAGRFADDLRDQLQRMRRAFPQPDQGDVRVLPGRHDADFLDVDLAGDHVVTEPVHHLREKLQAVAPLVRDEDAKMLGVRHG